MIVLLPGPSQEGGRGGSQFLAKQLTLSQPGGADYAHHITPAPPPQRFLNGATSLERAVQSSGGWPFCALKGCIGLTVL